MKTYFDSLIKIDNVYNRKENSFHFYRLIFAIAVVVAHSAVLFYDDKRGDILQQLTNKQFGLGGLAVHCFFIVSGFLITQSAVNSTTLKSYMMNRILRIFPALIVSLLFMAFIIGPFLTALPLAEYFRAGGNDPFNYVFKNLMLRWECICHQGCVRR